MKPLSLTLRRVYATASFIVLIITLPVALLYASGYRLDGLSLAPTGGVFIATPFSGITISINGEARKESSIFNRAFFIDSLRSGTYVIQTDAPGYYPWSKNIYVIDGMVTDVSALMVEQPLSLREIVRSGTMTGAATTSPLVREVSLNAYEDIESAFKPEVTIPATALPEASLLEEEPISTHRGYALFLEEGDMRISWTRSSSSLPSNFCLRPLECRSEFIIEDWGETVMNAAFYRGGIVFETKESGLFFTDVDVRLPRFTIPLYTKPGSEFRIVGESLIVKDGETFYEVAGL